MWHALWSRYTTTLHSINSCVVKTGKLSMATRVYRGMSGMALPKEFWEANRLCRETQNPGRSAIRANG